MKFALIPAIVLLAPIAAFESAQPASAQEVNSQSIAKADLQSRVSDSAVRQFYEQRGWEAGWTDQSTQQLRQALSSRAAHGLDRMDLPELASQGSPAEREVSLTRAALIYAQALANGVADPTKLHKIYTVPRPEADLAEGLDQALAQGRVAEWLSSLAPQDQDYSALSQAYRNWSQAAAEGSSAELNASGLIRVGNRDPRVPRIAEALAQGGYLDQAGAPSNVYDERLASAVRAFQQDFGIAVDGIVGPNTIEALNTGADDEARAAAVALERRRWLVRQPPATRIDVNIADATLEYVRDGKVIDRRKVIVGTPDNTTPQLRSAMYRLVANPTWTVPRSIEEEELSGLSSAELQSRNMERRDGWIVQQSGPENALGLVKFDMVNDYAIYLHDTPSKQLFERNQRQFSHGCVRVEDALGFAEMIARDQGIIDKWQEARQQGDQTFVQLPSEIPVRLLYHPTHVGQTGEVTVQQDVYDWNMPVAQKLGFSAGRSEKVQPEVSDIGP